MSAIDIVAVTGNPRPGSRTASLTRHVAMEIAGRVDGLERARLVELDLAAEPADDASPRCAAPRSR